MGVVFQTTHAIGHVQRSGGRAPPAREGSTLFNTLCGATTSMQKTAIELSGEVRRWSSWAAADCEQAQLAELSAR